MNEVVLFLSTRASGPERWGRKGAMASSSQFGRICRLLNAKLMHGRSSHFPTHEAELVQGVKRVTIVVKGVDPDPHMAGEPTLKQLNTMNCWSVKYAGGKRTQTEHALHLQTIREKRADARVALQARLATARSSEIMDYVDPFLEKCFAKGRRKGWYKEEANGSVRFAKKQLARLGGCSAEELDAQFDSVWDSADAETAEEEEEGEEEENIVEQDKRLGVDHLERRARSGVDADATQELEAPPAPEDVWMWVDTALGIASPFAFLCGAAAAALSRAPSTGSASSSLADSDEWEIVDPDECLRQRPATPPYSRARTAPENANQPLMPETGDAIQMGWLEAALRGMARGCDDVGTSGAVCVPAPDIRRLITGGGGRSGAGASSSSSSSSSAAAAAAAARKVERGGWAGHAAAVEEDGYIVGGCLSEAMEGDGMVDWMTRKKKQGRRFRSRRTLHDEELVTVPKDELPTRRTMRRPVELVENSSERERLNDKVERPSEEGGAGGSWSEMVEDVEREEETLWKTFSVEAGGMRFPFCGKYAGMPLRDVPYQHLQCLRHVVESELASSIDKSVCSKSKLRKGRRERRAQRALVKQNSALVEKIQRGFPGYCYRVCSDLRIQGARNRIHWEQYLEEALCALNSYFHTLECA